MAAETVGSAGPGGGGCACHLLLGLIGGLSLRGDFRGGGGVGWWRAYGKCCLNWSCCSRRRSGRKAALALFGLQIAHARVDGLAHVVLHVLKIVEGYGDVVGFGTFLSAFAGENDGGGSGGVGWRRRGDFND